MPTAPIPYQLPPKIIADAIDLAERHARHLSPEFETMALNIGRALERFADEAAADLSARGIHDVAMYGLDKPR